MTGMREGFGNILAEGSLRLATAMGDRSSPWSPRAWTSRATTREASKAWAWPTPPRHRRLAHARGPAYFELLGVPVAADPHTWRTSHRWWPSAGPVLRNRRSRPVRLFSVRYLVEQNLMVKPLGITELLNAATGAGYTPEEVERIGERIFNAERLFLLAAGFTARTMPYPAHYARADARRPAKGMVCSWRRCSCLTTRCGVEP